MLSMDSYPVQNTGVIGKIVDSNLPGKNEAVLVLPDQGKLKVLNDVGARIWALCDGSRTIRQIAGIISSEYAVSPEQAETDTSNFIQQLVEKGVCRLESKFS